MNIKYSIDGQAFNVISAAGCGLLVEPIYEGEYGEMTGDHQIFKGALYDKPPVEKYAKEVSELLANIQVLRDTKCALQKDIQDRINKHKLFLDKCKRYEALTQLEEFVEGKITHYVMLPEYGDCKIIDIKEAKSDESRHTQDTRLLTLYGRSNGNLAWMLGQYCDHSGTKQQVVPCTSFEQAIDVAKKAILEKAVGLNGVNNCYSDSLLSSAKSIGLELPKEWMRAYYDAKAKTLNDFHAREKEKVSGIDAQAKAMESLRDAIV